MKFGLFYFANESETSAPPGGRYRLLLEGAKFADENGFSAVWTPERHFHPFGGLYPNPSVTGAAVAAVTSRVSIRAGSVVAPLHHPLRLAEEWSVVDNISGGRAGISLASGWHARDFSLNPSAYEDRRSVLFERAEQIRHLWRGQTAEFPDGLGNRHDVRIFPPPVQTELPIWITSSGDIETFRSAGRIGAGLLTHMLGQDSEQLAVKIAAYRKESLEASGHRGNVVVMTHTFLGSDDDAVRELVREPLSAYMRSSLGLILGSKDLGLDAADPGRLRPDEIDFLVERSFERYFQEDGLMGSVEKARGTVSRLEALDVDEIACLIDFGLPDDEVLAALKHLNELREQCC